MIDTDWIDRDCPASGRRAGIVAAIKALHARQEPNPLIVEVGTLRNASRKARINDGWSTYLFGWYASKTGARVVTIDPNPRAMRICKKVTRRYAEHIEYVRAQAEHVIAEYAPTLLYLDGPNEPEPHLAAFALAAQQAPIVLIDDIRDDHYGPKGTLVVPTLLENGYELAQCEIRDRGQALLVREGRGAAEPGGIRAEDMVPRAESGSDPDPEAGLL